MIVNPYTLGALSQVSYLTDNIQRALAALHEESPFLSFVQMSDLELSNQTYMGLPGAVRMHSAVTWTGSIFLELIQPLTAEPLFRLQQPAGTLKLHHLGFAVIDLDETTQLLEAQDVSPVFKGEITGLVRSSFFDTTATLGHYIEFLEVSAQGQAAFEAIRNGNLRPERAS